MLSLTYPNNDVLTYVYGDHGMPVSALLNGAPLVNGATYNALKKLTSLPLGNGLATTWQYYGSGLDYQVGGSPNKWFGLPYQVQTGSLQSQTFSPTGAYDLAGNPTAISYADHTIEALSFSYNELDQLTAMSGSASEGYGTYIGPGSYDVGNLLQKGSATLIYPAGGNGVPHPHAPSSVSTVGSYSYDNNGNRSLDPSYTYNYDVENHLTSLVAGSALLQNTFDGDGVRLVRVAGGTTTHYVGDWYEYNVTTNTATLYFPFSGLAIAMKQGTTLYYLHRDQVGSVVSVSNASGGEDSSLRYGPLGNLRTGVCTNLANLPTDRLFTGQVRDLGDDRFCFFKSRYYDATIGRFSQPDNTTADPNKPQSLNRYAYADNCPLKYRDSTGHASEAPQEMIGPSIVINVPAPPQTQPLIFVAPPLPSGPLIFTGQLNVGAINIHVQLDLGLGKPLINVQDGQGTLIFKAKKNDKDVQPSLPGMEAAQEKKAKPGVEPHQVGTYGQLVNDSNTGDNLEIHHVPQKVPAARLRRDYDPWTGPAIVLPRPEHAAITELQAERDESRLSWERLLSEDLFMVRQYTGAPQESIDKLAQLNQTLYP